MNEDRRPVLPRYALLVENAQSGPLGKDAAAPPRSFPIGQRSSVIGSAAWAGIRIEDPFVSGEHARLLLRDADLHLDDLESTNGTRVNGVPVTTRVAVRPGDVLQFADVVCRVESLSRPVPAPGPPPSPSAGASDAPAEPLELPAVHPAGPFPGEPRRFRLRVGAWLLTLTLVVVIGFWLLQ